jgi:WD40 repeat protein
MIAEKVSARLSGVNASGRCSRRDFLGGCVGLLAVGGVVGGLSGSLAGCASTSVTRTPPTRVPSPLAPSSPITTSNAARIARLATFEPMNYRVRGVAWSPGGRLVASGSNPDVILWDSVTGQRLTTLSGHTDQIFSMAWSSAKNLLASASADGTVRIWDTKQGRAIQTLKGSSGASFFSVAWAPDGRKIVAGTQDGEVLVWDVATGKQVAVWDGPAKHSQGGGFPFAAWGVSWSPDGSHLISTRYDDLILIWDVATGTSRAIPKTDSQPNTVAWSPNGRQFALTDDQGKVVLWNGANAQRETNLEAESEAGWAYGLTWSPDGSMVASSRESGIVQVWDAKTGKQLVALQRHLNSVWGLAWSPDGLRLASASDDETVCLWGVV